MGCRGDDIMWGKGRIALVGLIIVIVAVIASLSLWETYFRAQVTGGEDTSWKVHVTVNGLSVGNVSVNQMKQLNTTSFSGESEGAQGTETGPLVHDVILLKLNEGVLQNATVTISSRQALGPIANVNSSVTLTWAEIANKSNPIIFDFAVRGSVKLSGTSGQLATRDSWIRDVTDIDIHTLSPL